MWIRRQPTHRLQFAAEVFEVLFADPPFHMEDIARIPTLVLEAGLLEPDGMLIVEHSERMDLSGLPGFDRTRKYGLIHFSFFLPSAS